MSEMYVSKISLARRACIAAMLSLWLVVPREQNENRPSYEKKMWRLNLFRAFGTVCGAIGDDSLREMLRIVMDTHFTVFRFLSDPRFLDPTTPYQLASRDIALNSEVRISPTIASHVSREQAPTRPM